jgi:magnesium transporter
VDDIFPFTEELEREVAAIEHIVTLSTGETYVPPPNPQTTASITQNTSPSNEVALGQDHSGNLEKLPLSPETEKPKISTRTRFVLPHPTFRQIVRRMRSTLQFKISFPFSGSLREPLVESSTTLTLRRMARTRRLMTNLSRLLATKTEVIARIQKRLLSADSHGPGSEEIAIYYGDVQGM